MADMNKKFTNRRNNHLFPTQEFIESHDITEREHDVVRLLASGYSNQDICRELGISLATVKTHVHNVLTKVGAKSRTELVVMIMRGRMTQSKG
jgi:DNA-binding NarL/FixJ family response regulator